MPDLENPLQNCLWAWCIMNSDACISLNVHPVLNPWIRPCSVSLDIMNVNEKTMQEGIIIYYQPNINTEMFNGVNNLHKNIHVFNCRHLAKQQNFITNETFENYSILSVLLVETTLIY